eukprot:CAMPEP_0174842388 /NCGR_PEP_ID=MMETSP1114-20130205/9884_1 /TAXON_ID=312471 /ORGANISM="Neobodo designis, Strain CCAP 1951/1" /LENGTH=308 /DNA_ID=CAMNT_0016076591 /DNA_START=31 /DNA_END=953 /DNA_ORIENTATION=+
MPVTGQPLSFRVDNELFHAVDVPADERPVAGTAPRPRFTRSSLMRLGVARVRQTQRRAEEEAEAEAIARAVLNRRSVSTEEPRRRSRDASPAYRASPGRSKSARSVEPKSDSRRRHRSAEPQASAASATMATPMAALPPPTAPAGAPSRSPSKSEPPISTSATQAPPTAEPGTATPSPPRNLEHTGVPDAPEARSEPNRSFTNASTTAWSAATPPRAVAFGHAIEAGSLPIHAPQPPPAVGVSLRAADLPSSGGTGTPAIGTGRRPASARESYVSEASPGGFSNAPVTLAPPTAPVQRHDNVFDDDVA